MSQFSTIQQIALLALPLLFAITLHEAAHGFVANYYGDRTAKNMGRLSLNPIRHIDPIGTIVVPAITVFLGGIIFGWAKPVPVLATNFKRPFRDMAVVALAGPFANLLMAIAWGGVAKIGQSIGGSDMWLSQPVFLMGLYGVQINLLLMVLNLLPIPPLDGSRVLMLFLPDKIKPGFAKLEPYGLIILLILIMTGILFYIIIPAVTVLSSLIFNIFMLS